MPKQSVNITYLGILKFVHVEEHNIHIFCIALYAICLVLQVSRSPPSLAIVPTQFPNLLTHADPLVGRQDLTLPVRLSR